MAKNQSNESEAILDAIVTTPYKYGFTTNLETEEFEKGLSKDIVDKISLKKDEPEFLKKFRYKAFNSWKKMKSPIWAYLNIPEIDYDNIQYYSVPKTKKKQISDHEDEQLRDMYPELLKRLDDSNDEVRIAV